MGPEAYLVMYLVEAVPGQQRTSQARAALGVQLDKSSFWLKAIANVGPKDRANTRGGMSGFERWC